MTIILKKLLTAAAIILALRQRNPEVAEEAKMTTCEIADNNMYRCQPHEVTTEDGYKLQLHRIPGAKAGGPLKGQTCFLMHGLMGSSAHWVMMGVDQGLAYYLCRMGCDVWLGNNRGNRYSRGHIKHNADDKATADYWDFSFHEMGRYDLPAMIDYISDATGQQRMHYVGHSQGCSQFAAMCDMRPEFASRIKSVHFMGPAIYLGQTSMQLKKFLSSYLPTRALTGGYREFFQDAKLVQKIVGAACSVSRFSIALCSNVLYIVTGYNKQQMNTTMFPALLAHFPDGASDKSVAHFAQLMDRPLEFAKYDYGLFKNLLVYGKVEAPEYDLKKMLVRTYVHYGPNDRTTTPEDVLKAVEKMPQVKRVYRVDDESWSHGDYTWAIDAPELIFKIIAKDMDESSQ